MPEMLTRDELEYLIGLCKMVNDPTRGDVLRWKDYYAHDLSTFIDKFRRMAREVE